MQGKTGSKARSCDVQTKNLRNFLTRPAIFPLFLPLKNMLFSKIRMQLVSCISYARSMTLQETTIIHETCIRKKNVRTATSGTRNEKVEGTPPQVSGDASA